MRTIIGLFDTLQEANQAHKLLVHAGFGAYPTNVVSPERVLQEHLFDGARPVKKMARRGALGGAALGGLFAAVLLPGIGAILGIGTLIAEIGAITAGVLGGAVAGGVTGALIGVGLPERDVDFYAEGIRRGGVLLTLRTDDANIPEALHLMRQAHLIKAEIRDKEWWRAEDAVQIVSSSTPETPAPTGNHRQDHPPRSISHPPR